MGTVGLRAERVTVRFGPTVAVDDVSLAVAPGQVVAVLGPSGCGKSTLLRAVAGLEPLDAGTVSFDGADLATVPTHRRGFAMMFQDGQLFMHLDVAGNVGYALRIKGVRGSALRREVDRLLGLVDLQGYAGRRPATLSGGEQQRVALARALAAKPRLLLLDEPLSALDRALRERLAVDLRAVLVATGTSALLVTHDQEEAFTVADRMAVMRRGQLVQQGPTAEVSRQPADAETARFLGYATILTGRAATEVLELVGDRRAVLVLGSDSLGGPRDAAGGASAAGPGTGLSTSAVPTLLDAVSASPTASPSVALRRTAVRLDPQGRVEATVTAVAGARDGIHLELAVPGWGPVAGIGPHDLAPSPGDTVRVSLDPAGIAVLPAVAAWLSTRSEVNRAVEVERDTRKP